MPRALPVDYSRIQGGLAQPCLVPRQVGGGHMPWSGFALKRAFRLSVSLPLTSDLVGGAKNRLWGILHITCPWTLCSRQSERHPNLSQKRKTPMIFGHSHRHLLAMRRMQALGWTVMRAVVAASILLQNLATSGLGDGAGEQMLAPLRRFQQHSPLVAS